MTETKIVRVSVLTLLLAGACDPESEPARPSVANAPSEVVDAAVLPLPSAVSDAAMEVDGEPPSSQLGYTGQVRPILARACVPCHSEGQIAPFSLDTYERAKTFAPLIAKVTRARTMPPSSIDNSGECNTFRDLPWLTDAEISTLEQWSELGAPEGDTAVAAPPVHVLPKLTGEIKTISTQPYVPKKGGTDDYRCFVVKSPLTEKLSLTGFDTRVGDKETAHHMVVFYPMDDISAVLAQVLDDLEEGPGYNCFGSPGVPATVVAAWAPGGGATLYPDRLGIALEPNRPLIIQMHYNVSGVAQPGEDRTEIDLQFQKEGVQPAALIPILDLEMSLPPGQKSATESFSVSLASKIQRTGPVQVYGIFPHMHELGKTMRVTASQDGKEQCLADVPRYSFHWQRLYFFDKPLTLDSASELGVHCDFDTSSRKEVTKWGESTADEMCVAGVFVKL